MRFLFRQRNDPPAPPNPDSAPLVDAWIAEGNALEDRGEIERAHALYERATEAAPDAWRAWLNLGNALRGLARFGEAAASYRRAIALNPKSAGACQNLGSALLAADDRDGAVDAFREATSLKSDAVEAWIGLGSALEASAPDEAIAAFEKALALAPSHPATAAMLARLHLERGDARSAWNAIEIVLRDDPHNVAALRACGEIEKALGHGNAAAAAYRAALAIDPDDAATWDAYLFALNLDETADAATILAEHRRYGDALARRTPATHRRPARDRDRVLRIGYVSPDFRRHSVSCFVEPLLRHHDSRKVEVHCYYSHNARDEITERFISLAERWHSIAALDDTAVAQQIADDGIDILVDLAGHTTGGRLGVFARKPAPIQITWLGYLCTTGLAAIDYRLCDSHTDPVGVAERWQVETPLRVPNSQWCYQPQAPLPAPTSLPYLELGHWTFGSFNQTSKLNPLLLARWAALLDAIPESRLRIFGVTHALFETNTRAAFAAAGVAPERLEFVGRLPIDRYFTTYADVDIALDSSPYNGATTTCDALLMGVPVVALAGERAISRSGVSLLSVMGLDDWIAPSEAAFVTTLQRQLRDPDAIARLRAALPSRMRASALMDGERFARDVEAVFRNAWIERCARTA
jgi:predicted O-linked N-acetylglucosamine transferase (SPINDLY family)